jgi:hypothetical protein
MKIPNNDFNRDNAMSHFLLIALEARQKVRHVRVAG